MAAGVEGLKGFSCIILVFYHEGSGIVNDPRDAARKFATAAAERAVEIDHRRPLATQAR